MKEIRTKNNKTMKKSELRQIVNEEIKNVLLEFKSSLKEDAISTVLSRINRQIDDAKVRQQDLENFRDIITSQYNKFIDNKSKYDEFFNKFSLKMSTPTNVMTTSNDELYITFYLRGDNDIDTHNVDDYKKIIDNNTKIQNTFATNFKGEKLNIGNTLSKRGYSSYIIYK